LRIQNYSFMYYICVFASCSSIFPLKTFYELLVTQIIKSKSLSKLTN